MENRINPELIGVYSMLPEFDPTENLETVRGAKPPPGYFTQDPAIEISEKTISAYSNVPSLSLRIYEHKEKTAARPAILYIHGGGYLFGDPSLNDPDCQRFALELDCVVVSVRYRLAPENAYPAALDDCYAALQWMTGNADVLHIDRNRIAVFGESAGGGLATAVALKSRDNNGPKLCFQVLMYPMLDDTNTTSSSLEMNDMRVWNRTSNVNAWNKYLGTSDRENVSQYAAPTRALDLSGLPPAYIIAAELDPFRDEDILYANRLMQAGVPTQLHVYSGCFHAFVSYAPASQVSQDAIADYTRALVQTFEKWKDKR